MVKNNFLEIFIEVLNRHAPVKQKHVISYQVCFINKTLKNAIFRSTDVNSRNTDHNKKNLRVELQCKIKKFC